MRRGRCYIQANSIFLRNFTCLLEKVYFSENFRTKALSSAQNRLAMAPRGEALV